MPKPISILSTQYRIPMKKLRMMVIAGDLIVADEEITEIDKIIFTLKKANPLSTRQLCHLLRHPGDMKKLGSYALAAEMQIDNLGHVKAEMLKAERKPHNMIVNASSDIAGAADILAEWLSSVIPQHGCNYAYLAVRACVNVEENFYELSLNHISKAIRRARAAPALEGMSEVIGNGTKFFQRKKSFDL